MSYKLNKQKFEEKELSILRDAVDNAEQKIKKKNVNSDIIKKMIVIVEDFIQDNKLICYGGTAINNILPSSEQFYDRNIEIPDYDFFSPNSLDDAKKLANIYYKKGFTEVEAKAGIHYGTFKLFVNFIPIADITQLDPEIFKSLTKNSIKIKGIHYAPPNYLRMSAYLELSRPAGDVSRWEKILKRLVLLNRYYPIKSKNCNINKFIRNFEKPNKNEATIYNTVKDSIIEQELVFFGGHAIYFYSKYMSKEQRSNRLETPDFDILAEDSYKASLAIKKKLEKAGLTNIEINKKDSIGEIIAIHYELIVDNETVAFIYESVACHSYNNIIVNKKVVKIATIDTMLSFYLAFIYTNRPYYDINRILCMSEYLFKVQSQNRLEQKGVLRRFSINCYGKQNTLENIRATKAEKFKELKKDRTSKEFEEYFLRYIPKHLGKNKNKTKKPKQQPKTQKTKTKKTKTKTKNKTKNKNKNKNKN